VCEEGRDSELKRTLNKIPSFVTSGESITESGDKGEGIKKAIGDQKRIRREGRVKDGKETATVISLIHPEIWKKKSSVSENQFTSVPPTVQKRGSGAR